MRWLLVAGVLVVVALSASGTARPQEAAQARWVITDLGRDCSVAAINGRGQIVGQCWKGGEKHAFVWRSGKATDLGTLGDGLDTEPKAINSSGQIIGRCVRYGPVGNTDGPVESFAFLWENGRLIKLGTLGGKLTQAEAINAKGQVVGHSQTKNGTWHAVLWEKGRITDLWRSMPGYAIAVNEDAEIVGTVTGSSDHAFLWEKGRTRGLGTLGGDAAYASAINGTGEIVGGSSTARGTPHPPMHAFVWKKGRMLDLDSFGSSWSEARAINWPGQIVGIRNTRGGHERAFVWDKGRMNDLPTLGGKTTYAAAISDRGQIVGTSDTKAGTPHAFVWEDGRITDLGTYGGESHAIGIGEHDRIIGSSTSKTGQLHAVLWMRASG